MCLRIWRACRWVSFDRYQTGDILSVITYDVDTVNQSLSADLLQILQTVVTVTVSLGMMLSIAPKLVLIFCVTIPATIFFTRYITARVRAPVSGGEAPPWESSTALRRK